MSPNTIALFGHNGAIGKHALRALTAMGDALNLRVCHRASSDTSAVPLHVVKVVVDLQDEAGLVEALKDVDVVLSTIGNSGVSNGDELSLARACLRAHVKNYIPSYYSSHRIRSDAEADEYIALGGAHIAAKYQLEKEIKKLGVPATIVCSGLFADYALTFGFVLPSIVRNAGQLYGDALRIPYPISSFEYVGQALAEIATEPPTSVAGRTFLISEFAPTGADLVSALALANATPPMVTTLTSHDVADMKRSSGVPFAPLQAHMHELWGTGDVINEKVWKVNGGPKRTLVEYMRKLKEDPPKPPQGAK